MAINKEKKAIYDKAYRIANKEKKAIYDKAYRIANKEKRTAYNRAWDKANPKAVTARNRKHLYGITPQQYNDMHSRQNGKCAICDRKIFKDTRNCHVDHCHKTGEVRGLLCQRCNHLIGNAYDNIAILNKAISYLRRKCYDGHR